MNRPVFGMDCRALRRSLFVAAAACALAGIFAASRGAAQGQPSGGVIIYRGDSVANTGVTLAGWGSGTAVEDTAVIYSGSHSIKMTTQGLYQGGRLILAHPADLAPFVSSKFAYLELPCLLPQPAGAGGRPGGATGGARAGGGLAGLGSAVGRPRRGGGRGASATRAKLEHNLTNIRVQLIMSDDRSLDLLLPIENMQKDNRWTLLAVPVPSIPDLAAGAMQVKEIRLFGDQPCTLHLGAVRVAEDVSPIVVDPMLEAVFPTNVRHLFVGHAAAGATPLKYSWDWNEADGIQDEANGPSTRHTYYHEGDYTATLTVSDLFGGKPPVVTKFHVKATP
jgi:hypothetical protein